MKKINWIILILLTPLIMYAQNKQFTLEDLNFGGTNYYNMIPENRYYSWWGDQLVHKGDNECYIVNKVTGKEQLLFKLSAINNLCETKITNTYGVSFPYAKENFVLINDDKQRVLYDFAKNKLVWRQNCNDENNADWSAASRATAFVRNNQLYITDADNHTIQLTTDGSRDIVYGQSVHRDEFGIYKGTFWSNSGQLLAFYRMDQSMVADYPQVNVFAREATYEPDKYPMTGETSHQVKVGIYNIKKRKTIYLNTGDPTNRYFTNIQWSPDDKTIYLFELNRDQNDLRLVSYNAETGNKIAELYQETDDKYVEPLHPITFIPWNNNQFIMQSQKDGYNHLYLFDKDGRLIKQITRGKWVVMDMIGFNESNQSIIYSSNECNDIQQNLWSVSLKTGKRTLLDNGKGYHQATCSPSGKWLYDKYSEPNIPRNIEITETGTAKRKLIFSAQDPWKGYNVPEYSCGTIKAADDTTTLYYRMVKPVNFDKNKKYPTVIYVYGGPHAHNVDARWHYASRSWETYMAQKGYLLFILDNRGSENRGKVFEQATFRHLGVEETKDQMKGVEYLKSLSYVDTTRIGVHGWSFGGYMTITMMTTHPDVFKVGVAGGPVIDWKWYEVMYGERYMDTPQTNPEGYAECSLINKAKNLKGKLQIIQGYNDKTVVPQHCLSFIAQCIKEGTQPDFFVYPGEPHNMRGHQSVHLHERITQYFEDYLK